MESSLFCKRIDDQQNWTAIMAARSLNCFNALSPISDESEIYPYIITTCSNIQVMRIKTVITRVKMS